jgi:hypothetical protein
MINVNIYFAVTPITVIGEDRAPSHTHAKGDQRRNRVVNIGGRRIVNGGRIARHIDDLRVGRLHLNDLVGDGYDLRHVGLHHHHVGHGDYLLR